LLQHQETLSSPGNQPAGLSSHNTVFQVSLDKTGWQMTRAEEIVCIDVPVFRAFSQK